MALKFNGKVAIVTGAGGGLGKAYALLLASKGAAVVVNDLGGTSSGVGSNKKVADIVVDEIRKNGGNAVANYDSVEDSERILQSALDNFGRIDILINNAGILRDRSFEKMSDDDWDLVQRVHLRGAFLLSRVCWSHFRKQKYGRIIMTSSLAGLCGNFGQANYGAAKMGLVGLSNVLAIEGGKHNIHTNVIVPMAASRLTEDVMPPDILKELRPEYIAPVVVWLCHDLCRENGGIFEVAGGWVGKYQWQRSQGAMLRQSGSGGFASPEAVRDIWNKATDMTDASIITSIPDSMGLIMDAIENSKGGVIPSNVNGFSPEKAIQHSFPPTTFSYTSRDAILYALGVGVSTQEADHLRFLYENSQDFAPLPTFGIVPMQAALLNSGVLTGGVDGLAVNFTQLLHGEQYLEILQPLLPEDVLESRVSLVDILDKNSGALIIVNVDCYRGQSKVLHAQSALFIVGAGKFGGPRSSDKVVAAVEAPSRKPDTSVKKSVFVDQAALYRLSGDINPLHIDPDFAVVAGFSRPILHGLCTYGIVAKEVLRCYANNEPKKFRSMKARFVKPVLPGQKIEIDMWIEKNRVFVQCKNVDTGDLVLSGGYVDLNDVASLSNRNDQTNNVQELKSEAVFAKLKERAANVPGLSAKVNALFQFNILKNGKMASQWTVDLRTSGGSEIIYNGAPVNAEPQCTLTLEDDDLVDLVQGKLKAVKAFISGKLKISGDKMLSTKLQSLFNSQAKL